MQDIISVVNKQKVFFDSEKTRDVSYRIKYLKRLGLAIKLHEKDIMEALKKDLNKAPFEAYATEIGIVLEELRYVLKHINSWAVPKRVTTPIVNYISTCKVFPEPYGIVLVMSPWNYPFQLTIAPLIGAIAAGNCVVVKPSNYSPYTSKVIELILSEVFKEEYVTVILGGRETNQTLLEQKFDYIFFTGSVEVGKLVMSSAAKNLTPVTLELGGKSPCIVDETADLELAARRIIWGKYVNAGQTCVAPDYLLVHHSVKEELIEKMKGYIVSFYGSDGKYEELPKIINQKHYARLLELIEGEKIIAGGVGIKATNQITPTILDHITWDSRIMQEEIFGPILPIIVFNNLNEIVARINSRPKPLALYFFTKSKERERKIIQSISFGGGCINDTIMHLATSHAPFGGVGESGMGGYHGKASFDTFSHHKNVMNKSLKFDIPLRYPPYKNHLKLLKMIFK